MILHDVIILYFALVDVKVNTTFFPFLLFLWKFQMDLLLTEVKKNADLEIYLWSLKALAQYRCVVSFSKLLGKLTIDKAPKGHFCYLKN